MCKDIARTSLAIFLCQLVIFFHWVFELVSLSLASSFNSLSLSAFHLYLLFSTTIFSRVCSFFLFFLIVVCFTSSISLCGGGLCFSWCKYVVLHVVLSLFLTRMNLVSLCLPPIVNCYQVWFPLFRVVAV